VSAGPQSPKNVVRHDFGTFKISADLTVERSKCENPVKNEFYRIVGPPVAERQTANSTKFFGKLRVKKQRAIAIPFEPCRHPEYATRNRSTPSASDGFPDFSCSEFVRN
jgi:hypothetical protein